MCTRHGKSSNVIAASVIPIYSHTACKTLVRLVDMDLFEELLYVDIIGLRTESLASHLSAVETVGVTEHIRSS